MKRGLLEKQLSQAGCYMKREGAEHSLWLNPRTGIVEAIPRHSEIKEGLAKKILKNLTNQ
jgi:mRNA interferase HicA